jgi:peroxiredoxin
VRNHLLIGPTLITIALFLFDLPSALPQPASLNLESSESLLQLDGKSFDLNQYRNRKAVVLVAHAASCPVMRQNYPAFKDLAAAFKAKSVQFVFINPLSTDSKQKMTEEIASYDLGSELFVTEKKQQTLLAVGLRTVGQAAVLVPKGEKQWDIVFRGGISDRVNFDRATERPSKKYLEMALDDVLKKRKVRTAEAPTFGCSISDP